MAGVGCVLEQLVVSYEVSHGLLSVNCPSVGIDLRSWTQRIRCSWMSQVPRWPRTPAKRRKI